MARIALVSKKWSSSLETLALSLHQSRHEVLVITSQGEAPTHSFPFQILSYFQTWSSFEAIQFFARFLNQAPEIWHFVFSDPDQERPTLGMHALAAMAKSLPRRTIATSLFGPVTQSWRWKAFLSMADLATCPTRESLMHLKRKNRITRLTETEVIPPMTKLMSADSSHNQEELMRLTQSLGSFLLVPSDRFPEGAEWDLIEDHHRLLICGARRWHQSKRTYLHQTLSDSDLSLVMDKSKAVLIAFSDLDPSELMRIHQLAEKTKTPVIAHPRQAEALPGLCVHRKNGWVLDRGLDTLRQILLENPSLNLAPWESTNTAYTLIDSCVNELNRLYVKVQSAKIAVPR
ncbi:MAG: hypothetical protein LW875_05845 [Proteobacteria bacterium]|jgi:hypothetical protein|nr:hypothetical protein [Pseudomonadota bacterium]